MVGRYNLALGFLSDRGNLIQCINTAAQMKAQGVKPNLLTYNCLIRACEEEALARHAIAIYEDMLAAGLQPDRDTFHALFKVSLPARTNSGVIADDGTGPFARVFDRGAGIVEQNARGRNYS